MHDCKQSYYMAWVATASCGQQLNCQVAQRRQGTSTVPDYKGARQTLSFATLL